MIADMHTHSEHSHDSVCRIEEMAETQIGRGTEVFAVTNHFDTHSYTNYDVFTLIRSANEQCRQLNHDYGGKCRILSGVEISEGFWHPEIYRRIIT